MEFEVGKLYRGINNIVKCISNVGATTDHFTGVLYNIDRGSLTEILICKNNWEKCRFKPYNELKETVITLQNGHKYNIPKGCKATITDDVIEIEEDIRYLKWSNGKKSKYFRVSSDKCLVVSKNENQPNVIWSLDSYATYNSNEVANSTKEEFEEAYNKAMEALKL